MANRWFTRVFGTRFNRELKRIQPIVDAILQHEVRLKEISDSELPAQTAKFREAIVQRTGALHAEVERLKQAKHDCPDPAERANLTDQLRKAEQEFVSELQRTLDDLLPEAFATVREAARRLLGSEVVVTGHTMQWDMVPYDVQLIGGIVLHQGKIAEMATGEGKTLVATLPLYLNALAGRGAHLVTVNNYLARRDSQWMGHLFTWLGLTVGCIDDTEPSTPGRRRQRGGREIRAVQRAGRAAGAEPDRRGERSHCPGGAAPRGREDGVRGRGSPVPGAARDAQEQEAPEAAPGARREIPSSADRARRAGRP